jgi:RNA 3'-terminal phosphate cyclase (ATP)
VVEVRSEHGTEVFTEIGIPRKPAEVVAQRLAKEVQSYLDSAMPVGHHLADQLLLPLALGAGGTFRTVNPTPHTRTNAKLIQQFLDCGIEMSRQGERRCLITVTKSVAGIQGSGS